MTVHWLELLKDFYQLCYINSFKLILLCEEESDNNVNYYRSFDFIFYPPLIKYNNFINILDEDMSRFFMLFDGMELFIENHITKPSIIFYSLEKILFLQNNFITEFDIYISSDNINFFENMMPIGEDGLMYSLIFYSIKEKYISSFSLEINDGFKIVDSFGNLIYQIIINLGFLPLGIEDYNSPPKRKISKNNIIPEWFQQKYSYLIEPDV